MVNELVQSLAEADQSAFLFLNSFHNSFWDFFMTAYTGKFIWIPMYASILFVLFRNYHWKTVLFCLIAIALTITFADQVCATLIRPIVERPRPANLSSPIADLVYIVNGHRGGSYGFPSCHASNSFGLAFFLILLFRKQWLSLFICCWAIVNCYTRIYLGLHYPGDLLVGMLVGCIGASIMYGLLRVVSKENFTKARNTETISYVGLITILGIIIYAFIKA